MTWIAIALTGMALVAFWLWWNTGSVANSLDSPGAVMRMLQYLVNRGLNRAELRFQVREDRSRRITFTKYIKAREVGITGSYHEVSNHSDVFERFRQQITARGVRHRVEHDRSDRRLITIDLGRDLGLATMLVSLLFEQVLGVDPHRNCVAYFKYVVSSNAPHLTGVDAPDEG